MGTVADRLIYLVDTKASGNAKKMADMVRVNYQTFHNYLKGRPPNSELLYNIREYLNVDLNWLLTGRGTPYIKEERVRPALPDKVTDIDQAHCDIVARFKNKAAAREANMDLLKLERVSPAKFEKALGYIKGLADGLEEPAGDDQVDKKNHAG